MSSPTRFEGQWANGRWIDPAASKPFKNGKLGLLVLQQRYHWLKRFDDPNEHGIELEPLRSRREFSWRYNRDLRFLKVPEPTNWRALFVWSIAVETLVNDWFELEGRMNPLEYRFLQIEGSIDRLSDLKSYLDPTLRSYNNSALEQVRQEYLEARLPQFAWKNNPNRFSASKSWSLADEFDRQVEELSPLPPANWGGWEYVSEHLRRVLPIPPAEPPGDSALGELLS